MIKTIAEIGWNHCGDMKLAKKMISAAKNSGSTYAKFQTWSVDRLKPGVWDVDGRRQIYEKAELTEERHIELINYCNEVGIEFMSSVFSIKDAELLVRLGVNNVKIPSFESRNHDLIKYCDQNFKSMFMSTGTSTFNEIAESVQLIKLSDFYLLHCVSVYPCDYSIANISKLKLLQTIHNKVGYSDHIQGVDSAKVAIGEGAVVIEKHFTTDKNLPGRDNRFAILPEDMEELTTFIKRREDMFIEHGVDYLPQEKDSRDNYRGRWDG